MMSLPHISVCICTYKRPHLLARAVEGVLRQGTRGLFTFSVVVADNDKEESGRAAIDRLPAGSPVRYCVEPRQNIALARNCAVANATGDYIAFIDDDEFPSDNWLVTLYETMLKFSVDGVLAPVLPHFDDNAPRWVIEGGFYRRPVHPTGMPLEFRQCRTGNVLLKRELFSDEQPFRPECLSGEDQDFFRRQIEQGRRFIWCHEAPAYEVVPPVRWNRGFLARRALFRGIFAQRNHGFQPLRLLQAIISVPAFAVMLPIAFFFGQAKFMICVFKLSYHAGRLLAAVGINPIRTPYVLE